MSEEEKLLTREIKEIYLFLTEQEPTPDDEIEARDKLINKFKNLKSKNTIDKLTDLIDETLNKLENWDTLDLWFKEVESLPENIEKVIDISEGKGEPDIIEVGLPISEEKEVKKETSQVDIKEIVAQVSSQFKDEIGGLKEQLREDKTLDYLLDEASISEK